MFLLFRFDIPIQNLFIILNWLDVYTHICSSALSFIHLFSLSLVFATPFLETINLLIFFVFIFTPVRFWLEKCSDVKAKYQFLDRLNFNDHFTLYTQRLTNQLRFDCMVKQFFVDGIKTSVCLCVFSSYLITGSRYNQSSHLKSSFFIRSFHFRNTLCQLIIWEWLFRERTLESPKEKQTANEITPNSHVHCKLHSTKLSSAIYIYVFSPALRVFWNRTK